MQARVHAGWRIRLAAFLCRVIMVIDPQFLTYLSVYVVKDMQSRDLHRR